MLIKKRLFTPGPTEVPPQVLMEMARPIFHHRTPEYKKLHAQVTEDLRYVFQTKGDIVIFASSGTGAMTASVVNVLNPGDKAIVVRAGKFGERFGEICERLGVRVIGLDLEWGESPTADQVSALLDDHPDTKAVYTNLCETSTGAATDIRAIGEVVAKKEALLVVDGVSSVGAMEMRTDEWGVDLLAVGSQKALMMPPGLALLAVSEKAKKRIESVTQKSYYFDLQAALKKAASNDTPYTPAVTLVRGLSVALQMIREEGIENVWARHALLAKATRAAVEALGLEILPKHPANALTAVRFPEGADGAGIVKTMKEEYGVAVAGGQEKLKGKICRISHMGYCDRMDILTAIAGLEIGLLKNGVEVELGKGVAAAEKILAE